MEIQKGVCSCVLVQGGRIVHRGQGIGVSPLRALYECEDGRRMMQGAFLADKVIGKAAAVLAVLGRVQAVYGEVTSRAALHFLNGRGIPCEYGALVDGIQNRSRDGMCPVEQSVLQEEDVQKAYEAMVQTIAVLMAKKDEKQM